jgi:hypothetical protein
LFFIYTYLFLFDFSYLAEDEDNSYQESEGEDISLGSQDTNIDDSEIQDLEEEEATMPTPKKPSTVKKTTNKSVNNVAEDFAALSVKKSAPNRIEFYSVNWSFPYQFYSVVEGSKDILYTDFFTVNLPQPYIKQAKVLRGGMQFSFGMAVPKWFYEESYSERQMGDEYDPRHARVQARSRQVIQPVRREYNSLESWILGDCQIVNLPFQCVEGDYRPHWGNWATKGMQRVDGHKQYQKCVTFRLVSVEDLLERVAEAEEEVYGYADGDSDNSSMDGADID